MPGKFSEVWNSILSSRNLEFLKYSDWFWKIIFWKCEEKLSDCLQRLVLLSGYLKNLHGFVITVPRGAKRAWYTMIKEDEIRRFCVTQATTLRRKCSLKEKPTFAVRW